MSPTDRGAADRRAADQRARRQRRERYTRKRSESAAADIWAALIVKTDRPSWSKYVGILKGLHIPQCACVQCTADTHTPGEPPRARKL